MPWAAEQTIADTRAFLDAKRVQLASNDGFECAIVRGGRIIGMVGFHTVNWRDRVDQRSATGSRPANRAGA